MLGRINVEVSDDLVTHLRRVAIKDMSLAGEG